MHQKNDPNILKCIVCGREKTAEALKTRAFISAAPKNSVADRKGQAVMSALSSAADVGSIYSERKYIRKLQHDEKKALIVPKDRQKRKASSCNMGWASFGIAHFTSQHGVKSAGIGRPIGHL